VQAVHLIRALKHLDKLPLFVAYGKPWLDLIEQRCRMWREPYDEAHDFKVGDLSSAQAILQKF
jgi:hypothetical protein